MYRALRPLLFRLDAERAHDLASALLRARAHLPARQPPSGSLEQTVWGLRFPNPVGLAAGMDKGQVLAPAWFSMGFGFVEIGTVTPLPQAGNPRPRLFRLPERRAVINRMGFNNPGAEVVAERLRALGALPGPIGVNVGRNKDVPNERAADDYVAAFRALAPHASYAAVNVSSPNTPGLRALQSATELRRLVSAVAAARDALPRRIPLLVKISPDEGDEALDAVADAAAEAGADGLIAANTTVSRSAVAGHPLAAEAGGLSGLPLRDAAERACARLYVRLGGRLPIVGVGGIFTAEDAYRRIRAGASLVQLYTALVYEGPGLPRRIARGLAALLERDRLTIGQATGLDAEALLTQAIPEST